MIKQVTIKNNKVFLETRKYDERGNEIEYINSRGTSYKKEYDSENKVIKHIFTSDNSVNEYEYDQEGKIIKSQIGMVSSEYKYNEDGRLVLLTSCNSINMYEYNDKGDLIVEKNIIDNQIVRLMTCVYDYENLIVETDYKYSDGSNNINQIRKFNTKIGLDEKYYKDSLGVEYWNEYDERGLVIKFKDNSGREIDYTYNDMGKVTSIIYNNGYEKYFTYNQLGNIIRSEDTTGEIIITDYNEKGDIVRKENISTGDVEEYEYIYY